jgi:hypothetical protein
MTTECTQEPFPFHPLNRREVRGQFDGGSITSDAGGVAIARGERVMEFDRGDLYPVRWHR